MYFTKNHLFFGVSLRRIGCQKKGLRTGSRGPNMPRSGRATVELWMPRHLRQAWCLVLHWFVSLMLECVSFCVVFPRFHRPCPTTQVSTGGGRSGLRCLVHDLQNPSAHRGTCVFLIQISRAHRGCSCPGELNAPCGGNEPPCQAITLHTFPLSPHHHPTHYTTGRQCA